MFRCVSSAAVVLALSARPGPREELVFAVPAATVLERTLERTYTLELESIGLSLDGEPVPRESLGAHDIEIERGERLRITDRFEALEGSRPSRLVRTFVELGGSETMRTESDAGEDTRTTPLSSPLEGCTVVFAREPGTGTLRATYADDSHGEAALLEGLEEDLDLRRFLPAGPVDAGESWDVPVAAFQAILEPGGELELRVSGTTEESAGQAQSLRANLGGRVVATLVDVSATDEGPRATIRLTVDVSTHAEAPLAAEDLPEGGSGTTRSAIEFRLAGELAWDLDHGHARALELSGEYRVTNTIDLGGQLEGQDYLQVQTMVFGGETRFAIAVERRR